MRLRPALLATIFGLPLAACSTIDRLDEIGQAPAMSPVQFPATAQTHGGTPAQSYAPPAQTSVAYSTQQPRYGANSLWAEGARSFFKDQRAQQVGDIVTIRIDIADKAQVSNQTQRSRKAEEEADITNLLGLEQLAGSVLPGGYDPSKAIGVGSNSSTQGSGAVNREEKVELTIAATVRQVLPNGNLYIEGRQEVRVNFERRDLVVSGIVRPEDISATNEVKHTQMAEARIAYGGRGQITDVQQPRLGQQVVDIIFPF